MSRMQVPRARAQLTGPERGTGSFSSGIGSLTGRRRGTGAVR